MIQSRAENRVYSCCFTGHRPEKLSLPETAVCQRLDDAVELALKDGIFTFICGMARGVDLWAGRIVLLKKKARPEIDLICVTPFVGFENCWDSYWRSLYSLILSQADHALAISDKYSPGCFRRWNEWMVSHSQLVIAAYNGKAGGTRNTVLYAKRCGVPVYNVLEHEI